MWQRGFGAPYLEQPRYGAQRVHSPLPSRVMQPSGPRGCTGPMPVFYKKFLCFLQNYGMIPLDNTCSGKDEVSCLAAKKPPHKNLPRPKRAGFSTTGPTLFTPPTSWPCCSPSTLAACAPPQGPITWCSGPMAPRWPPLSPPCWRPFWAPWPTTKATRSACSWPVWFWAWPLRCSPP